MSSSKMVVSSHKMGHFQAIFWGFGDYGQFDLCLDGAPESAASINASHDGKRGCDPKSRKNAMLKYKE
ncbi:MAG: hypothetical protein EXS05_12505 [Planctomycetaceae bacterium]|nr:hypothetical protein [Planctomycetaceae bacterium]